MFAVIDWFKIGAGALAGAIVGSALVTLVAFSSWLPEAREEARQQERAAALQHAMDLIETRSKTNAEIRNLDDAGLCRELGGLLINGVCQ